MSLAPAILAASDAIPPAAAVGDRGWAGLILLLPLCSMIACAAMAMLRVRSKLPAVVTALAIAGAFATVLALAFRPDPGTPITIHLFDWIRFDWTAAAPAVEVAGETLWRSVTADFGFYVDSLTVFWMLFVTGLGTLIAIYASEYMESDRGVGYCRFFFGVSLFLLAMSCLVMADNLVLLYLGWEGVGLASYLLIGYYYQRPAAVAAAKKAFIMNRIGDAGLALGIFLIWVNYGSVEFSTLFAALEQPVSGSGSWDAAAIPFCLMIGAFGKSAQIPLFTWLPDAMEGPTPVSALIHAATMVTAGVYMVARSSVLFALSPVGSVTVAGVGVATALFAATIALKQTDIKKVLAYSTVSQLGYMFLGVGVGAYAAGVFHLMTHAFFKALLFLGSGAVIHSMHHALHHTHKHWDAQDMRNMGGLRRFMPVTALTMWIGTIAIAGIWPFAGFFSKDEIIWYAGAAAVGPFASFYKVYWVLALAAALLTAFYMTRMMVLTFHGANRTGDEEAKHLHEAPLTMTLPLSVLAVLSVFGGWINVPEKLQASFLGGFGALPMSEWLHHWLDPVTHAATAIREEALLASGALEGAHHYHGFLEHAPFGGGEVAWAAISTVLAAIVVAGGFIAVSRATTVPADESPAPSGLGRILYNKWYVDELYDRIVVRPIVGVSRWMWKVIDQGIIDGAVNLAGGLAKAAGWTVSLFQTGSVNTYAFVLTLGVLFVLLGVMQF
jgi:NADH-quinone oxidoreductase subunit L